MRMIHDAEVIPIRLAYLASGTTRGCWPGLWPTAGAEDSVAAIARLVEQGKVAYLGVCEVSAETLRRAAAVPEVTGPQREYSL